MNLPIVWKDEKWSDNMKLEAPKKEEEHSLLQII